MLLSAALAAAGAWAAGPGPQVEGAEGEEAGEKPAKEAANRQKDSSPAGLKLEASREMRKARQYDQAFKLLEEALRLEPSPKLAAEILFTTGETHFRKAQDTAGGKVPGGDPGPLYREAVKALTTVLERYPGEEKAAEAAYLRGSCHLMLGEMDRALSAYQQTFDGYPTAANRPQALLRIGVCQAAVDEPRKAQATFQKLLGEYPGSQAEVAKARKYLLEVEVTGRRAPEVQANQWLLGVAQKDGMRTFEGEVVVLVFFATWCKNCSAEVPHLRALMDALSPKGVVFLGVANPDDPENPERVDAYVERNNLTFLDVALDRTWGAWKPYRVTGLPAAALIDRKGTLRWRGHPAFFPSQLAEKLLEERSRT